MGQDVPLCDVSGMPKPLCFYSDALGHAAMPKLSMNIMQCDLACMEPLEAYAPYHTKVPYVTGKDNRWHWLQPLACALCAHNR